MSTYYKTDDAGEPVKCDETLEWGRWMETAIRHVGKDDVDTPTGPARVSTVFLGIDHNFSREGPPVLWETMVFGVEKYAEFQDRYTSRADALAGHARVVKTVTEGGDL